MGSASILHLRTNPPLGDAPGPSAIMSAFTPNAGRLTTQLLDPAAPLPGAPQFLAEVHYETGSSSFGVIMGRWITRPLPAQVIGAGNWTFYGALRSNDSGATGTPHLWLWGFCLAQWRTGTGVVARLVDAPTGGTDIAPATQQDRVALTTQFGGGANLSAGDQLILEVWIYVNFNNPELCSDSLLLGGLGQYYPGGFLTYQSLTDTDAVLIAPAPVAFS